MAKKILIFGATGSVGSSLAKLVKESSLDAHLIGKNEGEISKLNSQRTKLLKDKYTLQISEKDFNDIDLHIGSEIRKHQEE